MLVRKGRDKAIISRAALATRVDVSSGESARPGVVGQARTRDIQHVESDDVEETGLRNHSDNSDGFTCSRGHRAAKSGFGANGRAAGSRTNTTNSGGRDAARSRDGTGNVRRNRYRGESAELREIGRYLRHKDRPESQSHAASSFNVTGHGCIQA